MKMVEFIGKAYEVYEIKDNKVILMDLNDGTTTDVNKAYFETLRVITDEDLSTYDKKGNLIL